MSLKISKIVQRPIGTNCYIITDGVGSIVIDTGSEIDAPLIKKAIVGELYAVVLTHLHYDHCAGAHLFEVPVYVHKSELKDIEFQHQLAKQSMGHELILPQFKFLEEKHSFGNISFEVIHTPGHTKGGVCLLFEKFIITGDTLFAQNYGRTDIGGNNNDMIRSLLKLASLDSNLVAYPGHGEPTTIGAEKSWIQKIE